MNLWQREEDLETTGHIHSIESFGTVDGPGIRFVVFCQGCPLRCAYCHNPDTWETGIGELRSVRELLDQYESYRPFLRDGGLTVTGGEPLLQIGFLIALFREAKRRGIHTAIDTSGITFSREPEKLKYFDTLMEYTDLVLLDIKRVDPELHRQLTGKRNDRIMDFARYLDEKKIDVWVRHVVVPGINNNEPELTALGRFLASLSNVKTLDILPYHVMGKNKYKELGLPEPLPGIPALTKDEAIAARDIVLKAFREERKKRKEGAQDGGQTEGAEETLSDL